MVCKRGGSLELNRQLLVKVHEFLHHCVPLNKTTVVGRFLRLEGIDLAPSVLDVSHVASNCRLVRERLLQSWDSHTAKLSAEAWVPV
eukprot:4247076-Pleurochrysis_carterae.AAC.2